MDYIDYGTTPWEEDCAQVGTPGYGTRARREANRLIQQLRETFGEPPEGAGFSIQRNPHDFGTYLSVRLTYEGEEGRRYAMRVDDRFPARWAADSVEGRDNPQPSLDIVGQMALGMIDCEATDGCIVEPDGECPHGKPAWPRKLGLI